MEAPKAELPVIVPVPNAGEGARGGADGEAVKVGGAAPPLDPKGSGTPTGVALVDPKAGVVVGTLGMLDVDGVAPNPKPPVDVDAGGAEDAPQPNGDAEVEGVVLPGGAAEPNGLVLLMEVVLAACGVGWVEAPPKVKENAEPVVPAIFVDGTGDVPNTRGAAVGGTDVEFATPEALLPLPAARTKAVGGGPTDANCGFSVETPRGDGVGATDDAPEGSTEEFCWRGSATSSMVSAFLAVVASVTPKEKGEDPPKPNAGAGDDVVGFSAAFVCAGAPNAIGFFSDDDAPKGIAVAGSGAADEVQGPVDTW